MSLNEIGPSSRERLTTLAKSIGREEFAMNVLEIPDEKVLDMLADELAKLYDMRSLNEVTRYSGFMRSKPDPDSVPFNPTGAVAEFREDLRALFGKFKDELNNRKFIGGVAEVMVNWKSLLRSQMNESISLSDYNEDVEKAINVGIRVGSNFDVEDVMYYVHNNWMGGNISAEEAMKKISDYLSPMKENIDPEAQKKHKGKSAPFGSAYKLAVAESLRDWFKKEDWVRINTSGNIAGPCGTMKKGKPTTRCLPRKKAQSLTKAQRKATVAKKVPSRCLPRKKAQSLTKAERKATVAKKVRGSKKGKQFVKNTKKSEFKKKK